ncbi:MAG TPA: hypothetical protein VKA18_07295, partial [Alphaproteobacteria bacterium]|nr:hypothetical protein [Alphaproteobacteria bacterium]
VLRQTIRALPEEHPAAPVRREFDFYSLAGVRDALAHTQEHDYTLPQVAGMLDRLDLRFLGFESATTMPARIYRSAYPDDRAMADLMRWDTLEEKHPDLFHHMYQFWCLKTGG